MPLITCDLAISLDGFVAGPEQSVDHPLGIGGERLHQWIFRVMERRGADRDADTEIFEAIVKGNGAFIMGNNMFGGQHGVPDWRGWWGAEPPYHAPVFVLTNHPRKPLVMEGGTTFNFTDGIESALEQARDVAGDADVAIADGPNTVNRYLAAGLLDELHLHIVPVVLGSGERLFENVGPLDLRSLAVVDSPTVTHVRYRIVT